MLLLDPWLDLQWHLLRLGVPEVHTLADGAGLTVAVVDSGLVPDGPDGLGHVGAGWDFVDGDADPTDDDAAEAGRSHGTHVAGSVGQATGNGVGGAGVAPGAVVLPVRALAWDPDHGVVGYDEDVADAIVWAVDAGADVINASVGAAQPDEGIAAACAYAAANRVIVVAAAGNSGPDAPVDWPGALPGVLTVGAHGPDLTRAAYSPAGPELDLLAPGGSLDRDYDENGLPDGIFQETATDRGWRFAGAQGTSMASPLVAGAAALLLERGWDPEAVPEVLRRSAFDLEAPGFDEATGHGALDLPAALAWPVDPDTLSEPGAIELVDLIVVSAGEAGVWVRWRTEVAGTTELHDGWTVTVDPLPRREHAVLVPPEATFGAVTVASVSGDGQRDEAEVALGEGGCTTGPAPAGWAWVAALLGVRRLGAAPGPEGGGRAAPRGACGRGVDRQGGGPSAARASATRRWPSSLRW